MKKILTLIGMFIFLSSCQTNNNQSLAIDQVFENYYQESLKLYPLNATSQKNLI